MWPHVAASILVRYKNGPFGKIFLALSRDVGTVRVHRDSEALCRCKSGTGPRPGIMSASSGSVFIIAALDHLTCQVSVANDGAREDCGANSAWRCRCLHKSYSLPHSMYVCVCGKLCGLTGSFAAQDEFLPRVMTSYSVVSDGHAHKVPASRVERAGGGDGCEDIRWDRCARPSAVRVTGGPRSFRVHHFFPTV